jgi:aminomethyltransferase
MVDFAGWSMPVQYTSIVEEHRAVRNAAGLFDIAHMGRLRFTGPQAAALLDHLVTANVSDLAIGQVRYCLVANHTGGVLDDVTVYRLDDSFLMVVNASNREKVLAWIEQHRRPFDAEVTDQTTSLSMLAVQGPKAEEILRRLIDADLSGIGYYRALSTELEAGPGIVARMGYTGEDGFEVILPAGGARKFWKRLIAEGEPLGLKPAGLGARDTLRLEAAMPLYGHELDEETSPFQAGLGFAVKLDKGDFIGREALVRQKADPTQWKRIGLELEGRRIAREGYTILDGGAPVGHVTSGTFSPTLETSIAMGYVEPNHAVTGTVLKVDVRGQAIAAKVVKLPFYKRK